MSNMAQEPKDSGWKEDLPPVKPLELNKLALIPTEPVEGILSALDHSPMIREALREYLECDIETFGVGITESIKHEYAKRIDEINRAEEEIMKVQASNMKLFDALEGRDIFGNVAGEKFDLSEETAKKFNLIRFQDVKTRNTDISYDGVVFEEHDHLICPLKNLNGSGPHLKTKIRHAGGDTGVGKKLESSTKNFRTLQMKANECMPRHVKGFTDMGVTPLHNKWDELVKDKVIVWQPDLVQFDAYKVGHTYLKKVMLTNIANRMAKFEIRLEKNADVMRTFDVVFEKAMHRHFSLAPGMHMDFGVRFKCTDLDDHKTWLDIDVVDGHSFRIEVKTKRPSPTLISEKFFFPSTTAISEFKKSAAITIDCGTRFLGTETVVSTSLLNVGSEATYFITSEQRWELSQISNVVKENTAFLPPFSISPVLFRLDAGGKINLSVTFTPVCEGLHTEKLMILCDNLALRSVDVIGEAVLFSASHFCINAQSKKFDVCEEDFYEAIYCVDFGYLRRNSSSTQEIRFTSECPVEVEYYWELRPLPNWPEDFSIKPNQLKMSPNTRVLCAISSEDTEITCSMGDVACGVYKSILCFVAKNIPKLSLKEDDIPGQRPQSEQMVMIDLMFVELRLNVIDLYIELYPPLISFRNDLFGSDHYWIRARNMCPWEVNVAWNIPEKMYVECEIDEPKTSILPDGSVAFSFMLTAKEIGKFQHTLWLGCSDDGARFPLIVQGEVLISNLPRNTFLCHDLGPQLSGIGFDFDLPLEFDELIKDYPLEYSEVETVLNSSNKAGENAVHKILDTANYQTPCIGFTPFIPENLHYSTILNKSEGTDLRLTTTRMGAAQHSFFVDTVALIQDADVILEKEEIMLGVDFYQRVPIRFKATLINKNHVSVNFSWLPPKGPDVRHVVVEYEPKSGRICGLEKIAVELTLTTDRPGLLEGLVMPCALENTPKTLHLKCRGYAQDVVIRISYPSKNETVCFTWPRVPSTLLTVSEDLDMKDERCCICFISKFSDVNVPPSWGEICEPHNLIFTDSTTSLYPYENWPSVGGFYYGGKFHDDELRRDFFHNWDIEDLRRRMTSISIEERSEVVKAFAQHALVFHINTYEANNTLTMKIENLTPIHTRYEAEVQEFVECDEKTVFKEDDNCVTLSRSRESLIKILGGPQKEMIDKLCQKIQPKAGLHISLANSKGQLRLNESIEIKVTAFANCWGVYFDHIAIRIPELPPVIVPVLVVAKGSPVWFTMSPPVAFMSPKSDPTIHFHEMLSRSTAKQTLFVYNDSFLPVKLAWTTYARRPSSRAQSHLLLPDEPPPFSVNLEVHAQLPSSFCQVSLTDGYGDVDSRFYDVEPRIMYLKPKQTLPLTVKVNTRDVWFDFDHNISLLRGAAHSFVYLDENEEEDDQSVEKRIDGGFSVYRPDGSYMDPLVLKMETKIEIAPLKTLNDESTVFVYKVRAYEVTENANKVYEEGRLYLFQNASNSIAEVKFSSTGNLFIIRALLNGEERTDEGSGIKVIVRPGDIVELKTVLRVSDGDLRQLICRNVGDRRYADDEQYPLTTIMITHRDGIQQVIPIYINVQDSQIELSTTSLDFGDVFLHESKVLPVRIRCRGGEEAFSAKIVSGYKGVFKVSPATGKVDQRKYLNLNVTYKPEECLSYYGLLVVTPSVDALNKVVLLFGKGSWNYANHQRFAP